MARNKKNTIHLYGQRELIEAIEDMGADVEKACAEAITVSGRNAINRYKQFIQQHKISGLTEESIVENPKVENDGKKITLQTGFDIENGGLAAIYLDRGTPKQKAFKWLQNIKKDQAVKGAITYVLGEYWRNRK